MEKITKKTTTVMETTRLELTDDQIAGALLTHFGMIGGVVSFDVSSGGFLKGAQIVLRRTASESIDQPANPLR